MSSGYGYDGTEYFQTGPPNQVTDEQLIGIGLQAQGRLRGEAKINDSLFPGRPPRPTPHVSNAP
jgi:hypothetical protein